MLRVAGLSLLLGLTALVAVVYIFFSPADAAAPTSPQLVWEPVGAAGQTTGGERRIVLSKYGAGLLTFPHAGVTAASYPYLHLALREAHPKAEVVMVWRTSSDPEASHTHVFETPSRDSLWIATGELPGWIGTIDSLYLFFKGEPGAAITVEAFDLHGAGLAPQLRAIYSDLAAFIPWNRSSMNSHTGVRRVSSFYPAPLFASLFMASLAVYLALCAGLRKVQFSWATAGLVFLGVWIGLDLVWHNRLANQVAETRLAFAGKSDDEKLRVGPDAALYSFVHNAREKIAADTTMNEPRVFVASSDDYTGLRAAYYFYPINALWRLRTDEIPRPSYLRSGDYLALLDPTSVELDTETNTVTFAKGTLLVEALVSDAAGTLVKVR